MAGQQEDVDMRALIIYESMYGNTRAIAESIGEGIRLQAEVAVKPVGEVTREDADRADLLIVGGPTHGHGMASSSSRQSAAVRPGGQHVEEGAMGPGIREWLDGLDAGNGKAAVAFDTRIKAPAFLTGRASTGIAKGLQRHGFALVTEPESFLVTVGSKLADGELDRAREWGQELVGELVAVG
jgi:flavodoxin-like protein